MKPGEGFAELLAGARSAPGGVEAFARGEVGWKFMPNGTAFAFGDAAARPGVAPGWHAGVGLRATW